METLAVNTGQKTQEKSANLVSLFIICFLANMFGGSVSTLMSVYLPVVVKELQGNQSSDQLNSISGYINSVFILGWAVGGFLWGLISDKTGRKTALLLAIASFGLFTVLTGLAPSWMWIMVARFLSGFGVGGVLVVSFTLISEEWPERSKAVYTGFLSISVPIGIFSAGAINFFVTSWREGFFIGFLPVIVAIAGYWMLTESAMWLEDKSDKSGGSKSSNSLISAANGRTLIVGSIIFGTMLIGLWAIFSWLPTWIQSLLTHDANKERGLSMMFLGMGGLTGGFASGWLVNFAGLRKSLIACFAVCAFCAFVLFKTNNTFSVIIYVEIAVLALFFGASQGILSIYIPQLFPTGIRASATGFCFNFGRLLTALAVLYVGVLVTVLGGYGNCLFIFSLVFVIGLIAVIFIKNIHPDEAKGV